MKLWFDIVIGISAALVIIGGIVSQARSHDWYDQECCSDKDCAPVEEVKFFQDEAGNASVSVRTKFGFAEGQLKHISIRPSKDDEYHACIITYHAAFIRCLYVPAGG